MTVHRVHTCLAGVRKDPDMWHANMDGFFNFGGQELNDHQIRLIVEYAIAKGYRLDCDIPGKRLRNFWMTIRMTKSCIFQLRENGF